MRLVFKILHHFIAHPLLIFPWKWTTLFHDWTALWAFTPEIVCVLYVEGDQLLGVARRGTTDQWGLPGGKVEEGEAPLDAAVREMFRGNQDSTHRAPNVLSGVEPSTAFGSSLLSRGSRGNSFPRRCRTRGLHFVGRPFEWTFWRLPQESPTEVGGDLTRGSSTH